MDRPIRLADVAALAAVSTGTASRALRDDPRISEATRNVVKDAANQLGYLPNLTARALRRQQTDMVGLLLPTLSDPMNGQVGMAIHQAITDTGYTVLAATTDGQADWETEAIRLFAQHRAAGTIIVGSVLRPRDVIEIAGTERVVFVLPCHGSLAGYNNDPLFGTIRADDPAGIRATVKHLLDQGIKRPAFVGGPLRAAHVTRRMAAEQAVAESDVSGPLIIYPAVNAGFTIPRSLMNRILRDKPDALICYDDFTALRLMHALHEHKIRIPEDIAVCGFDDIPFARMASPPLTTVAQPTDRMGRLAVRMLLECIDTGKMPESRMEPVRFVPRASTERKAK